MMKDRPILPEGLYKFEIVYVDTNYISKAGNKSIKLTLEVQDFSGNKYKVFEYLTKKKDPKTNEPYVFVVRKIKDLLRSIKKENLMDVELKNEHLLGARGHVMLKIEDSPEFGKSNKADQFVSKPEKTDTNPAPTAAPLPERGKPWGVQTVLAGGVPPTPEAPSWTQDDINFEEVPF